MMTNYNIGDRVSVLDDDLNGVVTKISGGEITVETDDGFSLNYQPSELIKIQSTSLLNSGTAGFNLNEVKKQKEIPKPRSFVKEKIKGEIPPPEYDLHIEKLAKNFRSMSNYQILDLQSETAKRHIEHAIRNRIPKIVFIHGVGEGVLKAELDFMLGRYDNLVFRDANYQKYGLGATEVIFKQKTD
ncbi:MAG: DNA mismatch repair protein MutS [Flavobacterium sp.]|nr:DNA mismatch repair protein MutS [Flavobacterium sp.]